jgi:phosphoesterase RecJ-like protein
MRNDLKRLVEAFDAHEKFFLVSHVDPDGDAVGSLIALKTLLERRGKKAVAVDQDGVPEIYRFLEGSGMIQTCIDADEKFDAAVFIECPNVGRAGEGCSRTVEQIPFWINIDHHVDNSGFGHLNVIDAELSAIGQLIYELFQLMQEPIDYMVGEALYTAIMTDTGSFRFSNTTPQAHIIVSELIRLGLKPHAIYNTIYQNLSKPAALIGARAHGTLEILEDISCITVTRSMLKETGATAEDTHDIVDFGRNIQSVEVALLFREVDDGVKVSLRSKSFVNVNEIAARFGGGGHLRAAGCTIHASMQQAKDLIFAAVRGALQSGRSVSLS